MSSNLANFSSALKGIVSKLKSQCPDNRTANRIRAAAKGALRNSVSDAMFRFKETFESVPGSHQALAESDFDFFVQNEKRFTGIKGVSTLWVTLTPETKEVVHRHLQEMYCAVFADPETTRADPEWSSLMTRILNKKVDIGKGVGEKLNEIVNLLIDFIRAQLSSEMSEATEEDLDGIDLSVLAHDKQTHKKARSELENQLLQMMKSLTDSDIPAHTSSKELLEAASESLDSPGAKPFVNALQKVCKRVDGTLIESFLSKIVSQIDTSSVTDLVTTAKNVDMTPVSHEVHVLSKSVQQAEVVESLRGLLVELNPDTLKTVLKTAVGANGTGGTEMLKTILKSDLIAGVASQLPSLMNDDGSINIDRLVDVIRKPRKVPAPPKLSRRR